MIEVIAANADGTLTSRNNALARTVPGTSVTRALCCYAIIIGSSDDAGDTLKLRHAAHDATAFAQAVRMGAQRLSGAAHTNIIRTFARGYQLVDNSCPAGTFENSPPIYWRGARSKIF